MDTSKPGLIRTGVVGVGTTALAIIAEKYMMPQLPDTPTVSLAAWVVVILVSMVISLFWDKRGVVWGLLSVSVLTVIVILIPGSRMWVGSAAVAALLFKAGWSARGWRDSLVAPSNEDTGAQRSISIQQVIDYVRINVSGMTDAEETQILKLITKAAADNILHFWGNENGMGNWKPIDRDMFRFHGWVIYRCQSYDTLRIGPGATSGLHFDYSRVLRSEVQAHWPPI